MSTATATATAPGLRPEERLHLIGRYRDGHRAVVEALAEVEAAGGDLDRRPVDGGWTAREVVHHLADSEMTSAIRLRRLLVEEAPAIDGYDEQAFAAGLHYGDRQLRASLEAFRWAREATAELLARMAPADWARAGSHSESGRYSAETWLSVYAAHAHEHAEQLKAAALG